MKQWLVYPTKNKSLPPESEDGVLGYLLLTNDGRQHLLDYGGHTDWEIDFEGGLHILTFDKGGYFGTNQNNGEDVRSHIIVGLWIIYRIPNSETEKLLKSFKVEKPWLDEKKFNLMLDYIKKGRGGEVLEKMDNYKIRRTYREELNTALVKFDRKLDDQ